MIDLKNVSRSFGPVKAVCDLSFHVNPGEIFALLGPNGAGKTTTIKMIMGLLKPDSGIIRFNGAVIDGEENEFKSKIGYVPENCAVYENLTGREYLRFAGNLHHLDPETVNQKSEELLQIVEMKGPAYDLIKDYSKGMKQKILILSALLHDPDLMILDEPFSGLDANSTSVFREIIRELAKRGKAVVFCSHVLEVVEHLVDRVLIINKGASLVTGTAEEIIAQTGRDTLSRAFNDLTGATDIDSQARKFVDIVNRNSSQEST